MTAIRRRFTGAAGFWLLVSSAWAPVRRTGANVNHEQAMKAVAGALAEARKLGMPMAVALVDTAGGDAGLSALAAESRAAGGSCMSPAASVSDAGS